MIGDSPIDAYIDVEYIAVGPGSLETVKVFEIETKELLKRGEVKELCQGVAKYLHSTEWQNI